MKVRLSWGMVAVRSKSDASLTGMKMTTLAATLKGMAEETLVNRR